MELEEKTLMAKQIFKGKIINVRVDDVILPDGRTATREIVEHSGAVAIIPLTCENNIIFVQQYRKPVEEEILEIPAGKLEKGENPFKCAERELKEETGYVADNINYITKFYSSPGFSNEVIHLFLARDIREVEVGGTPEPDEFLRIKKVHIKDAFEMVLAGEIKDGKTIIGVLIAEALLNKKD